METGVGEVRSLRITETERAGDGERQELRQTDKRDKARKTGERYRKRRRNKEIKREGPGGREKTYNRFSLIFYFFIYSL